MPDLTTSSDFMKEINGLSPEIPREDISMIEDILISTSAALGKIEAYNSIKSLSHEPDDTPNPDNVNAQLLSDILERSDMLLSEFKETDSIIDQAHLSGWSKIMIADHNGQNIDIEDIRRDARKVISEAFNMEEKLPFFADIKFETGLSADLYEDDPFAGLDFETGERISTPDNENKNGFDNGF